jgi:RNA polymerase sigma-70 factor (ECF subfamily)
MAGSADFQPTRWSLIATLRSGEGEQARLAREELCAAYWYPLYAYARRSGQEAEAARDLTQGFFAHLLEKNLFALARQERGRLRTFLLTAMQRYLRDEWRRGQRLKRGGGADLLSIDEAFAEERYAREPADPSTPEKIYERRWALLLLERTVLGLREEYAAAGKADVFDALKGHLSPDGTEPSGEEAGSRLGISPAAARMAIARLRARYRERLLREVAASMDAASEAEVEEEIAALCRALT